MTEYCQGERTVPAWAMGELEEDGSGDKNLTDVVNIIYVKKLDRQQILEALKKGRFYVAINLSNCTPLVLEEFSISDESGTKTAMMSEEVSFAGDPVVNIRISHEKPLDKNITLKLIRNNEIIGEFSAISQIKIDYKDTGLERNKKYYYRIDAESQSGSHLISNPIFFKKISKQ